MQCLTVNPFQLTTIKPPLLTQSMLTGQYNLHCLSCCFYKDLSTYLNPVVLLIWIKWNISLKPSNQVLGMVSGSSENLVCRRQLFPKY